MATRTVEVFSAGCSVCEDTIAMVKDLACSSCEVEVRDMNQEDVADRAATLGITTVPAVVVDGELVECCRNNGPDEETLRDAGLGQAA